MTRTVGLIGLGEIGLTYLEALGHLPAVRVAGVFDPGLADDVILGVPRSASLAELAAAAGDGIIVATPTATHAEVCRDLLRLRRPPRVLLVEKPLGPTLRDVEGILTNAGLAGCDVQVLYHVAYAPEVAWGVGVHAALGPLEGGVAEIDCHFSDLVPAGEEERFRKAFSSSWVDLGINALSVLKRFVRLESLELDDADESAGWYRARLGFVDAAGATGVARLSTAWSGDDKRTTIRFRSGGELRLDHQRVTGDLVGATSATSFALGDAVPRLVAHYVPMLSEILVEGHRRFSPSDDVTLHRLLLGGIA